MQQVSTSMTLILKLVIPVFWIVFFGTFTLVFLFSSKESVGVFATPPFRIGMLVFFLIGVAFLYLTIMRLKRVEMDKDFIYVTNYFKNFRYPYHNIDRMEERDFLFFKTIHVYFKKPGTFGSKIYFVRSRRKFDAYVNEHPELMKRFMEH